MKYFWKSRVESSGGRVEVSLEFGVGLTVRSPERLEDGVSRSSRGYDETEVGWLRIYGLPRPFL